MKSHASGQVVHTITGQVRGPAYFGAIETEADLVRAQSLVENFGWGLPGGAAMVAKAFAVERERIAASFGRMDKFEVEHAAGFAEDTTRGLGDK